MKRLLPFFSLSLIVLSAPSPDSLFAAVASDDAQARVYRLWEPEPAPNRGGEHGPWMRNGRGYPYDIDWERASYPLGNGTIGANVFGGTEVERIQISEKTFASRSCSFNLAAQPARVLAPVASPRSCSWTTSS